MSRTFLAGALNTVATYWRIHRSDGVALGFTTHDRALRFDGLDHLAAPGMLPSAIRLSAGLDDDEAAVEGALSHDAIAEEDLAAGRYDAAQVEIGLVDWETLASQPLYCGTIDGIAREGAGFTAELRSLKAGLEVDPVPCTGPSCRASFCGPGCDLSPVRFESRRRIAAVDRAANAVRIDGDVGPSLLYGTLRLPGTRQAGQCFRILAVQEGWLTLDRPLGPQAASGIDAILRQGCDKTIATCTTRFANAANFRGEPFLPGTDLLTQYPTER